MPCYWLVLFVFETKTDQIGLELLVLLLTPLNVEITGLHTVLRLYGTGDQTHGVEHTQARQALSQPILLHTE